jgi:hypothetical protein
MAGGLAGRCSGGAQTAILVTVIRARKVIQRRRCSRLQPLSMKIKYHDDFPKLDHRTAPSIPGRTGWVTDSPPARWARPGGGRHDQLGNFQTAVLGRITPASTRDRHCVISWRWPDDMAFVRIQPPHVTWMV